MVKNTEDGNETDLNIAGLEVDEAEIPNGETSRNPNTKSREPK